MKKVRDFISVLGISLGFLLVVNQFFIKKLNDREIVDKFHKLYYDSQVVFDTYYLGIQSLQYPTDNWIMQEIIYEVNPDFIIETGTYLGGTTLFYADVLAMVNENGKVITIDVNPQMEKASKYKIWKERVEFIHGDSVSAGVIDLITKKVKNSKVLVTLDSLHSKEHVLQELKLYAPLVSLNSYIVVQDTHLGGHPNHHHSVSGQGPWEAVEEFLKTNKNFVIDHSREKHFITQNPSGYLLRVK